MASELEARVFDDFADNMAGKLQEAAIIAQAASSPGILGRPERASARRSVS